MNTHRRTWIAALAVILAANAAMAQAPKAQISVAPATLEDALGTLVVTDVVGLIEQAGAISAQVSPQSGTDSMKAMLGMMLGDPMLQGLPRGASAVAVALPGQRVGLFVQVAPQMMTTWRQSLQAQGYAVGAGGGLLVLTDTPQNLSAFIPLAAQVKQHLLTPGAPQVMATILLPKIIETYKPMIETQLSAFPAMIANMQAMALAQGGAPGAPGAPGKVQAQAAAQQQAKVLEAELRVLYSLAQQTNGLRIGLSFPQGSVRVDTMLQPKPGTSLATFINAPTPDVKDVMTLIPAKGALRGVFAVNAKAYSEFVLKESDVVIKAMGLTGEQVKSVVDFMSSSAEMTADVSAIDLLLPGQPLISGSGVAICSDGAAAMAMMEGMAEKMQESGIADFYKNMNMEMKIEFVKDVGKHAGVAIHQFRMDQNFGHMPPQQAAQLKAMMGDMVYDIAVVDNTMVYALAGATIEQLIDAVKSGGHPAAQNLGAQKLFGPGAQFYMDIRLGEALQFVGALAPQQGGMNPIAMMAGMFAGTEPISAVGSVKDGIARSSMVIPGSVIAKAAMAGAMMAQSMGGPGGPGGPGGTPGMAPGAAPQRPPQQRRPR